MSLLRPTIISRALASASLLSIVVAGCSSPAAPLTWSNGATGERPPPTADAGDPVATAPPVRSAAPPDPIYPAQHAPMPLVDYNGGPLLTSPRIVTVTVAGDPMQDRLGQFGDVITQTSWWQAVAGGYCAAAGGPCIGPGQGGGHVVLPASPGTTLTDAQDPTMESSVKTLIRARIEDGTFPAPTPQTLYALYMPRGVQVALDTFHSCENGGFYGYHNAMTYGGDDAGVGVPVYYAVIMRCSGLEADATRTASHEIIEAATDPGVGGAPAYDMNNSVWSLNGGEVGDLCVDPTGNERDTVLVSGFTVQRTWSNIAATSGADPCVPQPLGQVYFNVAPAAGSERIAIRLGESATIELDAFCDAPMPSWTIDVIDFFELSGAAPYLKVHHDAGLVNNGTKISLTLTLLQPIPPEVTVPYAIVSSSGGSTHLWFGEVSQR